MKKVKKLGPHALVIFRDGAFEVYCDPGVEAEKKPGTALSLTGKLKNLRMIIVDFDDDPNAKIPDDFKDLVNDPVR